MATVFSQTQSAAISAKSRLFVAESFQPEARQHRRVPCCRRQVRNLVRASSANADFGAGVPDYGNSEGSGVVDANMMVLRKRIHRLRVQEASITKATPEDWMEWEKSCYPTYQADVAFLLGGLQTQLLQMRPSISLFLFSVAMTSMPIVCILLFRSFFHVYNF